MCYKFCMPIYEYSCAKCKKTIEVIQKMSSKSLRTHADCGGKLTKLISRSAFQLKGTGWYVTDYGSKSKGEGSESSKSDSGGTTKTAETSTEKAEKKGEAKAATTTTDSAPAASEKPSKSAKKKS
jgi:putative FmdB family regulatory protein